MSNENLKNFTTYKLSVPTSPTIKGFDDELISLIRCEMNKHIYKTILQGLFDTSVFDYVDISKSVNIHQSFNGVIDFLYINMCDKYKYLISDVSICNSFGDSPGFNFNFEKSVLEVSSLPYLFGYILKYDVYIDPFMRYGDNRICLFNNCEINVVNIQHSIVASNMFVTYDLSYDLGDSKIIFVLDGNEDSASYKKYKQLQRDIKINSVLDGSKEEN